MQVHTLWSAFVRMRARWLTTTMMIVALVALAVSAVGTAHAIGQSTFESADGNLTPSSGTDWNSFSPVTWKGTAPYQHAENTFNGWNFTGFTDAQATNSDTGFAGGVKQDVNCPAVIGSKAPNKDDLKRVYLSSKIISGHVYLNLAWERIPQNSTTASAHVGFEFNQSDISCPSTSDGLVERTDGDMLIVYDFTGGSSGVATITIRRWITDNTTEGACDITIDHAPCWGTAVDLTAAGFADAAVDDGATNFPYPVSDTLVSPADSLGQSEFGEAGIDLTAANVFPVNECVSFGQAEAVSRSSGNSGQAAMEDLVGPGTFTLTNCGTVTIIKHTDPRGINQNFSFTSNLSGKQISCTQPTPETPTSFTLNDNGNTAGPPPTDSAANTQTCTNVPIGSYTVTEGNPPTGFVLESLTCTATGSGSGTQDATTKAQADITIAAGNDTVTCTYTNQQQLGAIKITKTSSKSTSTLLGGAHFEICKNDGPYTTANPCSPAATGSDDLVTSSTASSLGTVCLGNLPFGTYYVTEKTAPTGYAISDSTTHSVDVNTNASCSDTPYVGQSLSFSDTPLTDLSITVASEATGGTQSTITCVAGTASSTTNIGNSPQGPGASVTVTANGSKALSPGTYTCTVVVDP